ncbi:HEL050Wp [Eremothecium sinecaudum]|uniref:ribonuclease Z n=1 Tax=Eremothecium sinecaudum TaxID=45286 RepID=A0A0X8HTN5_9SACH|nr:HEL050Wp [Eremothecium sinecaudum]AMD21230.1 HEL050Wp [Eremothecium sinecaudum]
MFNIINVTHPTADTKHPMLLILSLHGDRYFFGKVPEGAQRACIESKIKLSKLDNIFLTGEIDSSSIGGLPGMILTAADQKRSELVLNYGSSLLSYFVSTWRYFVFRFGLKLKVVEMQDCQTYENDIISVKSLVTNMGDRSWNFRQETQTLFKNIISKMFPMKLSTTYKEPYTNPSLDLSLPKERINRSSTSYEVTFKPIRGKFDVNEAVRLGVPKGPMFKTLSLGESVTLADGNIVKPEQVLSKQREFAKVLILDIPDDEYLQKFHDRFKDYDKTALGVVYYFLGAEVSINNKLISFMELFNHEDIHHFVSHEKICPNSISYWCSSVATLKLKSLNPNNYNLPITDRELSDEFYKCFEKSGLDENDSSLEVSCTLKSKIGSNKVHIFTRKESVEIKSFTPGDEAMKVKYKFSPQEFNSMEDAYYKRVQPLQINGVDIHSIVDKKNKVVDHFYSKRDQVELITLGTGSALPSKYRNVISTVVKVPYNNNGEYRNRIIILDAGENTLGSIHRTIRPENMERFFTDLKMIYLSHLHADHHLGILSLIKEWYIYNKHDESAVLYLVAPRKYDIYVDECLRIELPEVLERLKYIDCEDLLYKKASRQNRNENHEGHVIHKVPREDDNAYDLGFYGEKRRRLFDQDVMDKICEMKTSLNIQGFQTCRAFHCERSYCNSITFSMDQNDRPFKISYSGDTRPNFNDFAKKIGSKSDLLIHEATLENQLLSDAKKKKHSIINEAIMVSNTMGAVKLLLTHFSQRYPKLPQMSGNIELNAKAISYAFDGMITSYDSLGNQTSNPGVLRKLFLDEAMSEETEVDDEV